MDINVKTRSGLEPTQREIPYTISTDKAEEYLQGKINLAMKGEEISIEMLTLNLGAKFAPFVLYLPESVCTSKKVHNTNELSLFQGDSDKKINIDQRIYKAIIPYTYNKDDENAFFSSAWRRQCGVSQKASSILKSLRKPHLAKFKGGKIRLISVMIDPIRLFHDMLTSTNPEEAKRERFRIYINECKKLKNGNCTYSISRERYTGKHSNTSNITDVLAAELSRKIGER